MTYVIAHRGFSHVAPENTVPAFEAAVELGADGIECDVQLTRDARLVMHHNYFVDGTTSARGRVCDFTLDELRAMDFGSHKGPEFAGTRIATFDECLEACRPLAVVNVELKAPRDREAPYVRMVVDAVRDHGMVGQVLVSAFDHALLREVKELCPELRCGALTFAPSLGAGSSSDGLAAAVRAIPPETRVSDVTLDDLPLEAIGARMGKVDVVARDASGVVAELLEALSAIYPTATVAEVGAAFAAQADLAAYAASLDFPLDFVHPDYRSLTADPSLVARLGGLGLGVSPYTPDEPGLLRELLAQGCWSIITNRPDLLIPLRDAAEGRP